MTILNFDDIVSLNQVLKEQNTQTVHLHDTCGGQYFSLDTADFKTEELIQQYLSPKKLKAVFEEDKLRFTVENL